MHPLVVWIVFGALLGGAAGLVFRRGNRNAMLVGAIVGLVGASGGGVLFHRGQSQSGLTLGSLLTAAFGAIILLANAALATPAPTRTPRV